MRRRRLGCSRRTARRPGEGWGCCRRDGYGLISRTARWISPPDRVAGRGGFRSIAAEGEDCPTPWCDRQRRQVDPGHGGGHGGGGASARDRGAVRAGVIEPRQAVLCPDLRDRDAEPAEGPGVGAAVDARGQRQDGVRRGHAVHPSRLERSGHPVISRPPAECAGGRSWSIWLGTDLFAACARRVRGPRPASRRWSRCFGLSVGLCHLLRGGAGWPSMLAELGVAGIWATPLTRRCALSPRR